MITPSVLAAVGPMQFEVAEVIGCDGVQLCRLRCRRCRINGGRAIEPEMRHRGEAGVDGGPHPD